MAFVPLFFTGFEAGIMPPLSVSGAESYIVTTPVKTGSYSARTFTSISGWGTATGWTLTLPTPQSDLYFGAWVYFTLDGSAKQELRFNLSDGNYIGIKPYSSYNGYVNSTNTAIGTLGIAANTWRHLQVHIVVSDTGTFECRVDGCVNFSYSGDTKPGTGTTIVSISEFGYGGGSVHNFGFYLDNIAIGTGDWPGDLRVDGIQPSADTATAEWTPSTGATNYACVDERPPSDTDYISTTVTGRRTILELTDFDVTNKTPMAVNVYARMNKSNAAVDTIKYGIISGATETVVDQQLTTVMTDYMTFLPLNPDGNIAWDDASLDALKLVFESVVT